MFQNHVRGHHHLHPASTRQKSTLCWNTVHPAFWHIEGKIAAGKTPASTTKRRQVTFGIQLSGPAADHFSVSKTKHISSLNFNPFCYVRKMLLFRSTRSWRRLWRHSSIDWIRKVPKTNFKKREQEGKNFKWKITKCLLSYLSL